MTFGTSARTAIACVSRLAEAYDSDTNLTADAIARDRELKVPFVRKILSELVRDGLVTSSPGPHGGFALARSPAAITVLDVVSRFERSGSPRLCPFGGGVCGDGEHCPLHERLSEVRTATDRFLAETTFEVFLRPS